MISEPQDAADYVYNKLQQNAGPLGIGFVGYADDLVPRYPAAIVSPGAKQKRQHATHLFQVFLEVSITIYHARLDVSHKTRTREDLTLVTNVENLLEATRDMSFEDDAGTRQVVFAFVRDVMPGTIHRPKGEMVIGTRMIMEIESRKGFPYGA